MKGFSRKNDSVCEASRECDFEEQKLELRLGPPSAEDWAIKNDGMKNYTEKRNSSTLLSLGYSSRSNMNKGSKKGFFLAADHHENTWNNDNHHNFSTSSSSNNNTHVLGNTTALSPWSNSSSSSQYKQSLPPAMGKESLQMKDCGSDKVMVELQNAETKGFSLSSANYTAVTNSSQKRIAPVVGWPPIRSFRKNRASGCASKLSVETGAKNEVSTKIASKTQTQSSQKGLFVKINMDGVPIGRKVNLKAYDSYEKLSSAVDELFRGLMAAQIDSSAYNQEEEGKKAITGLLDGSGEYTLVYEDTEGDRMLVGDVPWNMFVSTVKRLRVLKSSELSSMLFGSNQEEEPT